MAKRGPGRTKMFVSRAQLESLFELRFTCAKVAKMLCMSEQTQCRCSELGLPIGQWLLYSQLSELDEVVSNVLQVYNIGVQLNSV